ncbi:MAG: hypothetical protein Q7J75_02720 [Rhodoferax sp.]|nr:hypothetical protein [Rhodoferax sp.]
MSELQLIAAANEKIKNILRVAENISLISVNAILVARQADGHAVGFGVVARELRMSSERMAAAMLGLSSLIGRLVIATARSRSQARRLNNLNATGHCSKQARASISAACQRSLTDLSAMAKTVKALRHELLSVISSTGKQCAVGMVIARSAAIEAAYGGAMQPVLRQIAVGIEASISDLSVHIHTLKTQLQEVEA